VYLEISDWKMHSELRLVEREVRKAAIHAK
jgi:hypothetical protein